MRRAMVLLALLSAAAPLMAGEGRVPIYQPTTITQPGTYILTRDIAGTLSDGIIIQSDGVTLDLNGHSILMSPGFNGIRVDLSGSPSLDAGVLIRNGRILGGDTGILGVWIGGSIGIREMQIGGTSSDGINITLAQVAEMLGGSPTTEVSGVILEDILGDGIRLADPRPSPGCLVVLTGNTLEGIGGDGIILEGCGNGKIIDNVIDGFGQSGNPAAGIDIDDTAGLASPVVESNVIRGGGALSVGVLIDTGGPGLPFSIAGNTIVSNGQAGILVLAGTGRIADNIVVSNAVQGMVIGGENVMVVGNHLADNGTFGIEFSNADGHAYRDNFLRGNKVAPIGGTDNTDAGGNIE